MQYFYPDYDKHLLLCPTCGNDNLIKLDPYTKEMNDALNDDLVARTEFKKNFDDHHFICRPCYDEWESHNEHSDEPIDVKGLYSIRTIRHLPLGELKDPGINKLCNYPDDCHCGNCPDPNQLKFNLHGAKKEWYN